MSNADGRARGCRVLAVIVAYRPDPVLLVPLLESLAAQVARVVVVDNTPAGEPDAHGVVANFASRRVDVEHIPLGKNVGIAAAQNVGIAKASAEAFDYVLLSDQDSLPDKNMVSALMDTAQAIEAQGIAIGCVCPAYFDETTGQAYRFQVHPSDRLLYTTLPGEQAMPWIEIVTAISSGSLIPLSTLASIGAMREEFFIDDVDTEWCHRARSHGFHNIGTARARLTHRLGETAFRVWYLRWRQLSEYSTTRLYYRFRNFALMAKLPHVPRRWLLRASLFWLGNMYAHTLFAEHRWANTKAIARGLWDGFRGVSGPLRDP